MLILSVNESSHNNVDEIILKHDLGVSVPFVESDSLSQVSKEYPDQFHPDRARRQPDDQVLADVILPVPPTPSLHQLYRRSVEDDGRDLDRDVLMDHLRIDAASAAFKSREDVSPAQLFARATTSAHKYTLPSTYPSSIASSWSRPERSVWFQQKAIIITSIFLAIFIVLFIGAAVFLRERKLDDELADMDDEEALARLEEIMAGGGRGSGGADENHNDGEKEEDGKKKKRRFRFGRRKTDREMRHVGSSEPSTGSSSAMKRRRHLVSRWTRAPVRTSRDTLQSSDDAVSVHSGRSARRRVLGDPNVEERLEVTYDGGASTGRVATDGCGATSADDRSRSPPPPHSQSGDSSGGAGSMARTTLVASGRSDEESPTTSTSDPARAPRRVALDDSDFQAADAAEAYEDGHHMPPAYISSGPGAGSSSSGSTDVATIAAAVARGDAKRGIPPPEERDDSISSDVIRAALAESGRPDTTVHQPTGPIAGHIATDDKAMLGALSAAASAPPVPQHGSAPAYGSDHDTSSSPLRVSGSSATAGAAADPSAPTLDTDEDGFELGPASMAGPVERNELVTGDVCSGSDKGIYLADMAAEPQGKGKGRQDTMSGRLPAPPQALQPAFSRFDQPYRADGPPRPVQPREPPSLVPIGAVAAADVEDQSAAKRSESLSARRSEKQREAEQEHALAGLMASRPGDAETIDVPRYERLDSSQRPSAPTDLADSGMATESPAATDSPASGARADPGYAVAASAPSMPESLPIYEDERSSLPGASRPSPPCASIQDATESSQIPEIGSSAASTTSQIPQDQALLGPAA
ncbi:hypothetical protein BCV70DRAFT_235166 [Testicularia cyperi]|uniref:Uncharacterized protein n=1 Tax=Testicularia cyperi TaxID=1882483 RepID=A0A317XZY0_9BASI|nr:hypothetical protein BCV70DRAFT_235166 [Testicularia cyperi]